MIACKTHIGYGAPGKQDTAKAHGSPLGADLIAQVREIYGWPHDPFVIPEDVKTAWEKIGARGGADRSDWTERFATLAPGKQAEFNRVMAGEPPKALAARSAPSARRSRESPEGCDAEVVRDGARGRQRGDARDHRRLGRPDGVEQHADEGPRRVRREEPQGPLHPLRHPRTRHGGGDERPGAARRREALWRHLPVLCRLRARGHAAVVAGHIRRSST
jgi:hypothetical protein